MARRRGVLQSGGSYSVHVEGAAELIQALRDIGADVRSELGKIALVGAEEIKDEANALAPGPNVITDLERLDKGIAVVAIGPDYKHWYYLFAETGAQPHEVDTRNREALKLYGMGERVFAEAMSHPGIVARPFIRPAADKKQDAAIEAAAKALERIVLRHCEGG